jgi:hypothetical protein
MFSFFVKQVLFGFSIPMLLELLILTFTIYGKLTDFYRFFMLPYPQYFNTAFFAILASIGVAFEVKYKFPFIFLQDLG